MYWSNVEHHTKTSTAWTLMSKKPQPAASSLLLDYITPNFLVVIWKSGQARHFPVLTAVLGQLIIVSTTVASTGLFSLQSTEITRNMTMSKFRNFDTTEVYLSSVDTFPVLLISSILSNTNEQFAVEPFGPHYPLAGELIPWQTLIALVSSQPQRLGHLDYRSCRYLLCRFNLRSRVDDQQISHS
jgi:hypothetical protein